MLINVLPGDFSTIPVLAAIRQLFDCHVYPKMNQSLQNV